MPQEAYLQLADWYFTLGLPTESLEVLSCGPSHAESYYWMAYLKNQLKIDKGAVADLIRKGNSLSPAGVFPFRSNSAEVLNWITGESPDWKPKYYLALIYWSRNDVPRAKELFIQCGEPDFAPFYASRAALFNNETYAADMKKAGQLDPRQWRYGKLLILHFIKTKNYEEALATSKLYHTRFPEDFRLSMLLARALLLKNELKSCTDILDKIKILPYEGATDSRELYHEAWLMQAIRQMQSGNCKSAQISIDNARRWPENLGVGKPYEEDIDSRLENYLAGICYEKTGKADLAMQKWSEVLNFKRVGNNVNTLIGALALRKVNRNEDGEKLLAEWVEKDPGSKLGQWCSEVYHGNRPAEDVEGDGNYRVIKVLLVEK
jgi:hypothetical protein